MLVALREENEGSDEDTAEGNRKIRTPIAGVSHHLQRINVESELKAELVRMEKTPADTQAAQKARTVVRFFNRGVRRLERISRGHRNGGQAFGREQRCIEADEGAGSPEA